MNVIDVAIVGGPDLAAVVERREVGGGVLLEVTVANDGPVPARLRQVVVPVETRPLRRVVAHGFDAADAGSEGPPAQLGAPGPLVVSDGGCIGWVGAGRHRGEVVVQPDGWLLTARADMGGIILAPGEAIVLDGLWLGDDLDGYLDAWRLLHGPLRPVDPVTGVVAAPGATGPGLEAALVRLDALTGPRMLVAGRQDDSAAVSAAARRAGVGWGVVLAPFGAAGRPADLSRPEALEQACAAGTAAASQGAAWVTVVGVGAALAARRWGEAASTPPASLRAGLAALRRGLGPSPVLHVAGGPPWVTTGPADAVGVGPGWPDPAAVVAATRRAPLRRRAWTAAAGPLPYDVPPSILEPLAEVTDVRLLWPPAGRAAG